MKRVLQLLAASAVAALAAACIPQPPKSAKTPPATAPVASASACAARVAAPWKTGAQTFTAEAFTDGPTCPQAVAILVIRDAAGAPLWTDTFEVSHNMVLASAGDATAMRAALADWVKQEDAPAHSTTATLPEWAAGAEMPMLGEFPLYLEEGTTREDYAALRAKKLPMFCYVQGMESQACLALEDGGFRKIGAQSFPG